MVFCQKLKKIKKSMKNLISILFVVILTSCGSQVSDLELRVAKLETEMASLRKGGVSSVGSVVPAGTFPKFTFQEEEYNFGNIQPIPVGGTGEIKVQFDSSNKPGQQNKVVTITANTESKVKKLLIRATVK